MNPLPVVLAFTGASGAPYGVRLLEVLARNRVPVSTNFRYKSGKSCSISI